MLRPLRAAVQLLAANVMNPRNIDVEIEDVSGLDEMVQELVRQVQGLGRAWEGRGGGGWEQRRGGQAERDNVVYVVEMVQELVREVQVQCRDWEGAGGGSGGGRLKD